MLSATRLNTTIQVRFPIPYSGRFSLANTISSPTFPVVRLRFFWTIFPARYLTRLRFVPGFTVSSLTALRLPAISDDQVYLRPISTSKPAVSSDSPSLLAQSPAPLSGVSSSFDALPFSCGFGFCPVALLLQPHQCLTNHLCQPHPQEVSAMA